MTDDTNSPNKTGRANQFAAHNPRAEAEAILGGPARVLEPSPPAVLDDTFADDPTMADGDDRAVSPLTGTGAPTWDHVAGSDPAIAAFAAARWLGNRPSLPALPAGYPAQRDDFHRLAYGVVAEARHQANGRFGLRYTQGGFGTPFFRVDGSEEDVQVRVQGAHLIVQTGASVSVHPITTLGAGGQAVGAEPGTTAAEHDSPELGDTDRPLEVSVAVNDFLGEWFGLGTAVMEQLRRLPGAAEASRVQLWPGHFDVAMELGSNDAGQRATYGASPGDHAHDEPYLYVGAWGDVDRSNPFWNETNFNGASLPFAELVAASDQYGAALDFFSQAHALLTA